MTARWLSVVTGGRFGAAAWVIQHQDRTGRWGTIDKMRFHDLSRDFKIHDWSHGDYATAVAVLKTIYDDPHPDNLLNSIRKRPMRVYNRVTGDYVLADILGFKINHGELEKAPQDLQAMAQQSPHPGLFTGGGHHSKN